MAGAMEHQAALLLGRLGWHKPHAGPGHRFADGLCVSGVILLSFDVGLDVSGRHQPHRVAQSLELTRPMMRRGRSGLAATSARTAIASIPGGMVRPSAFAVFMLITNSTPVRVTSTGLR